MVSPVNSTSESGSVLTRSATVRFGDFELSIRSGELHRNGRPVKLQQQPCKVLGILATRSGELVTRDELKREIWPGGTFVDFEHGINFCIKQIRAALGDDAQSPVYIETLPRRGYRFIAPVEISSGDSTPSLVQPSDAADPKVETSTAVTSPPSDGASRDQAARNRPYGRTRSAPSSRPAYLAAALLGTALLAAAAYMVLKSSARFTSPPPGKVMLAVMPFDYVGEDTSQQFLADGLSEETIMQLGGLEPRRLGVIARTSVMRYRQRGAGMNQIGPDIKQISKDLGVAYVVEGSVRTEADRVAIRVSLIQASDQTPLWSDSFESSRTGVLSAQTSIASSIASKIARALAIKPIPVTADGSAPNAPHDAEAHELYLRAEYLKNKGDASDLQRSVEYFKQAVGRDPGYAPAYSGLADSYRLLALTGAVPPVDVFPKSHEAAVRAVELDNRLPEAHTAMGSALFWFERRLPEAEAEFQKAIELNPSYGWAHHDYSWLLVASGRFDEAVSQIKQARALDPLSPLANSDVGWVYLFARRYDEAIDQIKRTLDLEPGFGSARSCLIQAYLYKGLIREALALGKEEMTRGGATRQELASIDVPDASAALKSYLRWALEKAQRASTAAGTSHYRIAQLYAEFPDQDRALESLAEAFTANDPMLVFLNVDPAFDSLRSDPRFVALTQRSGLS